jgi:hypothetical protein
LREEALTRCYKVKFRNGVVRWVVPNGKKDTEIKSIMDDWEDSTAQAAAELKSPAVEKFASSAESVGKFFRFGEPS